MKRDVLGYPFDFVGPLEIERDAAGAICEFRPHSKYRNVGKLPLVEHGAGPFCKLSITPISDEAGVYALSLSLDHGIVYLGQCQSLSARFGPGGYGSIQPRNCFKGGQSTNCKINSLVLASAKAGHRVDVWFLPAPDRKPIEARLISQLRPPWNCPGLGSSRLRVLSAKKERAMEDSMPTFKLTLQKTYYEKGFFNVTVDFDRFVRPDDGPVALMLGESGGTIPGKVNRRANQNGTARIMGGSRLRDWFKKEFQVGAVIDVDLSSLTSIRLG